MSLASQHSLLSSFAAVCSTINSLRQFALDILNEIGSPDSSHPRTVEAFADAVAHELHFVDKWASGQEELMVEATAGTLEESVVVSLLSTENTVKNRFVDILTTIHDIVVEVNEFKSTSPSCIATKLLDCLTRALERQRILGNDSSVPALMRLFVRSFEPMWAMIGVWVKNGMKVDDIGSEVDEEFFVQQTALVNFNGGFFDPDFWEEGYMLRQEKEEEGRPPAVPAFLRPVADVILRSGKTTGLLRLLDPTGVDQNAFSWPTFECALALGSSRSPSSISPNDFTHAVLDSISALCDRAGSLLTNILVEDCELWKHVHAVEDIFLFRRGDAMADFMDILFTKMDNGQPWDFHFLNSAFRHVVELTGNRWLDAALVRLSYRQPRDKPLQRTVKALDGLTVEYSVPFPLTYIFSQSVFESYGEIFVFLLQLKRSKYALERILLRSQNMGLVRSPAGQLKVVHAEVVRFHSVLRQAASLDEIISLHNTHLDIIMGRCLLQQQTAALHRAIASILDMTLQFADMFVAIVGDTTRDGNQSLMLSTRKRRRHTRKNVVGFSAPDLHESDSESDNEFDEDLIEQAAEPSISASYANDDWSTRLDKMSSNLDGLVKFIRRGMESLAGGSGSSAPAFGPLTFALEDWDI